MKSSKLLILFHSLSPSERVAFRKFLQSPYFNRREDVLSLYDFMLKESKKKKPNWNKTSIFQQLFAPTPYEDSRMRHLLSMTFKLMESFIAKGEENHEKIRELLNLAKAYRNRHLYKFFLQTVETLRTTLEKLPHDYQYYHFQYLLEQEYYQFIKNQKRMAEYNLQELSHAVDIRFLTNKLKQSCSLHSHRTIYNIEYDEGLLSGVLETLDGSHYLDIPAISIYYYCYLALTQNDEAFFQLFRDQIFAYQDQFSVDEMRDLYLLAINFCIKRLNTGQEAYVKEAFQLYQSGLENKVLLEKNRLSRFAYKNTVALGLRLKAHDWIARFLQEYTSYLEPKFRNSYFYYNMARLAYSLGDHQKAMSNLVKVDSSDLLLNIDAKVLLLKMYYELEEFDALDSLLSSMQTLLRRKNMLAYHRNNYVNIIRYIRKLAHSNAYDKEAISQLRKEIELEEVLTERSWLLQQLS